MSTDLDRRSLLLEQWRAAAQLHRHMDRMAWQNLSYFAALNGALLSVFALILSSDSLCALLRCLLGFTIALFAGSASLVWAKVHKRMQLYHRLRLQQATDKEKALVESMSDDMEVADIGSTLVYRGDKPVEDLVSNVSCSSWGQTSNYTLVFRLAVALMSGWYALALITFLGAVIVLLHGAAVVLMQLCGGGVYPRP